MYKCGRGPHNTVR